MTRTPTERANGWQLEEGSAAAYERYLVPTFFDAWAGDLLDAVGLKPGERALDVACGTGIVARHALRRVGPEGEVAGVDLNPGMLAVAREVAGDAPIRWHEASATQLPLPDGRFDAVLCQQGLQFLPDAGAALAEMARVTAPSGRLGMSTCRGLAHQPGYAIITDVLRTHVGLQAADLIASPYALGDTDRVRAMVEAAGFREVRARIAIWPGRFPSAEGFLRAETASSPLGELVSQLDGEVADALVADLTRALAPHTDDEGVVFPFETIVFTATR